MPALSEYDVESLVRRFAELGHPRGNLKRLLRRYYDSGGRSIDGPQVARAVRDAIVNDMGLRSTRLLARRVAGDGTVKLLVGVGAEETKRQSDEATEGVENAGANFPSSLRRSVASSLLPIPSPPPSNAS